MHQQSNGAQAHDRSCEISEVRFKRLEVRREIQMHEGVVGKPIAHFRELRVYKLSYSLALDIHKLTRKYPASERFELGSQLRRPAAAIPINIAGRLRAQAIRRGFQKIPGDRPRLNQRSERDPQSRPRPG